MPQESHDPSLTPDLRKTYDAIVVGSGAAGGMAAHVLTSHGMQVLLLEAGRKLPIEQELKSMQWPYDHPRRGKMPADDHALTLNEYTIRPRPYAKGMRYKHVYSYVQGWSGSDYSKNIVVDEKDHPYTGDNYAWVRARTLGGKTAIWGRLALRRVLAHFLPRHRAVLRQGGRLSRHQRPERESAASPRQPVPAAQSIHALRNEVPRVARQDGTHDHAISRRSHHGRSQTQ
jgi:hypothetical protein